MVKTAAVLIGKTRRDILKNWKQFLTIIVIAGLAVCLFCGFIANASVLQNRVNRLYNDGNIADLWVYTGAYDNTDKDGLSAVEGVDLVESRLIHSGFYGSTAINSMVVDTDNKISKYASIVEGEVGVMIEKSFAEANDVNVGDIFVFSYPLSAVPSAVDVTFAAAVLPEKHNVLADEYLNITFTISGIMTHPECVESGHFSTSYLYTDRATYLTAIQEAIAENYAATYVPLIISNVISPLCNPNQYVIKADEDVKIKDLTANVQGYFSDKDTSNLIACFNVDNLATNASVMSDITQAKKMTLVFPVIFFLVALLIILTTTSQIILRERMQIGTMKAIGLTNKEILLHYITLNIVLCTIGFVIGIVIGPFLIPVIMNQKYKMLFSLPELKFVFPILEVVITYLVFCIAVGLVSYSICKNEIRKLPAESMRPASPPAQKKTIVDKLNKKDKLPMSTVMAFRNIKVKKSRSIMVVVGIIGCIALLICGFGIDDTLKYGVKNDLKGLYPNDISVSYATNGATTALEGIDGIEYYENYTNLPTTLIAKKSYQTMIRVVDDDSKIFTLEYDKTKIAMSSKVAKEMGVKAGDAITFTVLGVDYTAEIAVTFQAFYYHGIVVSSSQYSELANLKNYAWVNLTDTANANAIKDNIVALTEVSSAITEADFESQVNDALSSISLMTTTLKVFAILLAIVVLYNIALLNYRERQRDIATLKVLGFNKREIANSLILEIMFLTIIGAVVGCFLGLPMTMLVLSINETPVVNFLYHVNFLSYVYSILLTVGTSLIINIILANLTDKVQMVESLKSYE